MDNNKLFLAGSATPKNGSEYDWETALKVGEISERHGKRWQITEKGEVY